MHGSVRGEPLRLDLIDCRNRLFASVGKFRKEDIAADVFLDQMVEFYHLATTVSPMFEDIKRGLDFGYGRNETGVVVATMIVCIWHPYNTQPNPEFAFVSPSTRTIATSISLPEQIQARPLFIACKDATLDHL